MNVRVSRRGEAAAFATATIVLGLTVLGLTALGPTVPGAPRLAAQEAATFTLTGQIVDAVNETPVIAAVVKVPDLRRFVFTDVNGRFAFTDFPEGTWDILVEQFGYHTLEGSVTVTDGNGLFLRLNPDPIELEGLRVRTRSEQLLERRRRRVPYRVVRIPTETIANAINPDPTAIFRFNAAAPITGCSSEADEWMTPGCVVVKGTPTPISIFLDEGPLLGGMVEFAALSHLDIHSMEWIPKMAMLRVYTRRFIERLDNTRISLVPLVW